jgi:hypothetical protein
MEVMIRVFPNMKMVLESRFPDILFNPIVITDVLLERVEECPIDISVFNDDSVDGYLDVAHVFPLKNFHEFSLN